MLSEMEPHNYSSLSLTTKAPECGRNRLFVNTNGTCFLCLRQTSTLSNGFYCPFSKADSLGEGYGIGGFGGGGADEDTGFEEADEGKVDEDLQFCHWNIFRYLKITPIMIAKSLKGNGGESCLREGGYDEDEVDFSVLICGNCSEVAIKMTRLAEKFENIQFKLDQCVEKMQDIMASSDRDKVLSHQFEKRWKAQENGGQGMTGLAKLLQAKNVADFLRKTTKQKCFVRLKTIRKAQHKLSRKKMEGDDRPVVRNEKISGEDVSLNLDGGVGIDEELVPVSNSSETAFSFEQPQEWITDVPEVAEEISIGLTSATDPIFGEELIEEIPPPSPPPSPKVEPEVVEPEPDPEPSSSSPSAPEDDLLTSNLPALLLPPLNLNLPPPPPVVKPKPLPGVPKRHDIPIDFYFHNKTPDHRYLCPFCTESGSTLTNIRFHVIRLHPEKLFAPARAPRYPQQNFRKVCDAALTAITKEADTGDRNSTGTKQVVKCVYCRGSPKNYNDKRAFLCHMILNHYPVIRRRILAIQNDEGYKSPCEPKKPTTAVTTTPAPAAPSTESVPAAEPSEVPTSTPPPTPAITNGTPEKKNGSSKKPKKRPSTDRQSTSPKSPKTPKKKKSEVVATETSTITTETAKVKKAKDKAEKKKEKEDVFTIPGKYDCDLCGKHLSSSTSRWRHKARYCNVAKDLKDQHLFAEIDQEEEEPPANHSLSIDGSSADAADVSLETSKYLGMDEMSGVGVGIDDHDHLNSTSHHEKIEMEMMMMFQDTNEDFMKLHGSSGEIEDDEDGNEQFLSDFQEFYDENEVNDVLLTMTMDGAHTEDPLHI